MVFLLMLCITGLPLIFAHEIDHWLHDVEAPELSGDPGRASVDAIIADAQSLRPGDAVQFLVAEPEEPDLWYVRLGTSPLSSDMSAFYTYDARTGEFLYDYPLGQGFMDVMLRLHVDMYAGLPGTLFLGAMGLLLLVSIVSGAVLYAPFMRKLPFGRVRRARSAKVKWLDLHNLLGIATLVWLFVVSLTGVINTLSIPIFGQWQATELAAMTAPYVDEEPTPGYGSVGAVLDTIGETAPDKALSFLAFPGNDFAGPNHYVAFMQGTTALSSKLLTPILIDADTAGFIETRQLPWYVQTLLLSQPLHFGDYGGLPLKILWAILDILAIIVLGSGVYLWLKTRKVSFESWFGRLDEPRYASAQMRETSQ